MTQSKNDRRKEKGFTLVEIIAVLVILGILAAVAVPRYFELTQNAQQRAVDAAAGEIQSRINLLFARSLTQGMTCTAAAANTNLSLANIEDSANVVSGWTVTTTTWPTAITLANAAAGVTTARAPTNALSLPTCN